MTSPPIKLVVQARGHVPSFKNNKMMTRGRLITDPKKQKWMKACVAHFEFQLKCACPITAGATLTAALPRFLTASLPQDDCWQNVPELRVSVEIVNKGDEGAEILIEPL